MPTKKTTFKQMLYDFLRIGFLFCVLTRFIISPGYVPSSSMELTLCKGDFIITNPLIYGGHTPDAIGFNLHKTKIFGWPTYIPGIRLPSYKLPGYGKPERGDVVTFYATALADQELKDVPKTMRPMIVKRLVGVPGDTVKIENQSVNVNGMLEDEQLPRQYVLKVTLNAQLPQAFLDTLVDATVEAVEPKNKRYTYKLTMAKKDLAAYEAIKGEKNIQEIERESTSPDKPLVDNMEEMMVPYKGFTIVLDSTTHALYIKTLENTVAGFTVKQAGDQQEYCLHGKQIEEYTFQEDYYFFLGDNFHASLDSRYVGMVPRSHIIAKVCRVIFNWKSWFSLNRFFKGVK